MTATRLVTLVLAGAAAGLATAPVGAEDPDRGRLLYENHCTECHTDDVHFREESDVRRYSDVLMWIGRWQGYLALQWSRSEMEDVAAYLNERYYGFETKRGE